MRFPWIVFLIYWIAGAMKTRVTRENESLASRSAILVIEVIGYLLIFSIFNRNWRPGNPLHSPQSCHGAILGVILTWAGIGLAIWARYHLAEYWSARVTIKEGHQLIRTGPYSRLRHPIYTGLILATIGSAMVIGKWRCVLGLCLVVAGYCFKARKEETMLTQQFGEAFQEHRKHTGFLIPRFR